MTDHRFLTLQRPGSAHRFCQDRFKVLHLPDRLILVLADGHGGKAYTRSGLGARMACAAAAELLQRDTDPHRFPTRLKERYDAMVQKHLAMRPLAGWEAERAAGMDPAAVYGATLLAAVLTPHSTTLYQLGDGEMYAVDAAGALLPGPGEDPDCRGSITSSLAHSPKYVLSHFRTAEHHTPAAAVLLFSDGCEDALFPAASALLEADPLTGLNYALTVTDHGDDQTLLLAWSPARTGRADFSAAFTRNMAALREEEARRRKMLMELEEFHRLRSYLKLAVRKAQRLEKAGDPAFRDYLHSLQKGFERFRELSARFEPRATA